jgi:hypothetical protein
MAETPASLLLKKQLRGKIPALITEISEKRRACLFSTNIIHALQISNHAN